MRAIKFRAWDREHHHMYANAYPFEHLVYVELPQDDPEVQKREHLMMDVNGKWFYWIIGKDITLMQFTGLKDKYDKEIWESDIVKFRHPDGNYGTGEVRYGRANGAFGFFLPHEGTGITVPVLNFMGTMSAAATYDFEVLGNIYENPELIEVKQ